MSPPLFFCLLASFALFEKRGGLEKKREQACLFQIKRQDESLSFFSLLGLKKRGTKEQRACLFQIDGGGSGLFFSLVNFNLYRDGWLGVLYAHERVQDAKKSL